MTFRTGLLLGSAFAAGIVAGPMTGLLDRTVGLPIAHARAQSSGNAETYRMLTLFGDVVERIRNDYVEPVNDRELIENAINGMLTGLDPHSSYMNAKAYKDMQVTTRGEFGGLGLEVQSENGLIRVVSPIDDTPAFRAGVKPGDLITMLDGQTVQGLTLNEAVDKMRGPAGSPIKLTIKRENVDTPVVLTMNREVIKIQVVKSRLDGDVGYVRLSQFTDRTDDGLRKAVSELRSKGGTNLKGFVLDLRGNPGGLLDQAISVSDDFLEEGEIVSTRARHPEESQRWTAKPGDITGGLPIVLLINGGSASASEIVAGALQDHHRAVLVGTRSFGKGSVQTVMPVPGGGAMRLTTARYYTPSGRSIQGLGIAPDVEVRSSRTEAAHFGPEREADLRGALRNQGGTTTPEGAGQRTDLPPVAHDIPNVPPEGFPTFDPTKPDTDFQLQQAEVVLHSMAQQRRASR